MRPIIIAVILIAMTIPSTAGRPVVGQVIDAEVAIADEGGIILEAPIKCEVGELVRLDARKSDVDDLVWDIIPKTPDFEVVESKRRGFFSARMGGEYLILIGGAKNGKAFLYHQKITVKGEPTPAPTGLVYKISQWVSQLPDDVPGKNAKLASMAGVFKKLGEGDIDVDKILEATALANSAVLGDDLDAWVPFLDKLGSELDDMIDGDRLSTPEQYRATWLEIAKGLEAASRG